MIVARIILAGLLFAIIGTATMATFGLFGQGVINADANRLQATLERTRAASLVASSATETFTFTVTGRTWNGESAPFVGFANGNEPLGYAVNGAANTPLTSTLALTYENGRFMGAALGSTPIFSCSAPPPSGDTYNTLALYVASVRLSVSC